MCYYQPGLSIKQKLSAVRVHNLSPLRVERFLNILCRSERGEESGLCHSELSEESRYKIGARG